MPYAISCARAGYRPICRADISASAALRDARDCLQKSALLRASTLPLPQRSVDAARADSAAQR